MWGTIVNIRDETLASIDAELEVAGARARVRRIGSEQFKNDLAIPSSCYRFVLCLTPCPAGTQAYYANHWSAHHAATLGNFFIVPPAETLAVIYKNDCLAKESSFAAIVCFIEPALIDQWFDSKPDWPSWRLEKSLNILEVSMHAVLKMITRETVHPVASSKRMMELLSCQLAIEASRYFAYDDNHTVRGGLATWRLRLIDKRIKEPGKPPTLDELAALCNISTRQLSRGFRNSCGCAIGSYIQYLRLENAKRLISNGASIKEIAQQMGYASPASFSMAFRRAIGVTPTHFR